MKRNNRYFVLDVPAFESDLIRKAKKYPSVVEEISTLFDNLEKEKLKEILYLD